jgi:hypothetical protein|tara:strand:+ start:62 stop:217 length:156 start_codon:yes stop_codon:yes gene_type:complete
MKVVATAIGFYAGSLKAEGVEFVLAEGDKLGSWMKEVQEAEKPVKTAVKSK